MIIHHLLLATLWIDENNRSFWGILGAVVVVTGTLYGVYLGVRHFSHRRARVRNRTPKSIAESPTGDTAGIVRDDTFSKVRKAVPIIRLIGFIVGGTLLLIFLVSTYVVQINTIRGLSMERSFRDGQRVIVYKLPVALATLVGRHFQPNRGDVVIVRSNVGASPLPPDADEETIVKRVIALPGERVVIDHGSVIVYNDENPGGFNPANDTLWANNIDNDIVPEHLDITIGADELFVCGDNRPVSIDSRFNGPISTNDVIGIVTSSL